MNPAPPPKVVRDIHPPSAHFSERFLLRRVNLSFGKTRALPLNRFLKSVAILLALAVLVFGSVLAPTTNLIRAADTSQEQQALEAQLQDLENQINQYENQVSSYQEQGSNLKSEIASLNAKISKLNLQIEAINLTLVQLNQNISSTQSQIDVTQGNIDSDKSALGQLLENLYISEKISLVEIFLANPRLSDFFGDLNDLTLLQSNLRDTILKILALQNQLEDQKQQFTLARADAASVNEYQKAQEQAVEQTKSEKNSLLAITRGQESKYRQLLTQTKQSAAQIRERIFQLLGGGELTFEQAYEYAKLAGDATGVQPALILAVLDRESALGKNVGQCSYQTAMSPSNQQIFLSILSKLNVSPNTVTVSCPNADGAYGGAMGPAQFLPSTWELYADEIAKITGHSPANPWNNSDAFVATALYLKAVGAAGNPSLSQERIAAAKYYAGSRWQNYLWTYGEAVVSRAESFQQDIATITG